MALVEEFMLLQKREEIRKGIEQYTDYPAALWAYLHSAGCVLKGEYCGMSYCGTNKDPHLWKEMFTVEPLIEGRSQ